MHCRWTRCFLASWSKVRSTRSQIHAPNRSYICMSPPGQCPGAATPPEQEEKSACMLAMVG